MDATSIRVRKEIKYSDIDESMRDIIRWLNEHNLYTTSCCDGKKSKRGAYIKFDTQVEVSAIEESIKHTEGLQYCLEYKKYNDFNDNPDFYVTTIYSSVETIKELFGV